MDKLAEIMDWKRKEISSRIRPVKLKIWKSRSSDEKLTFLFVMHSQQDELSVIAEIKRKSPSAGDIAEGISAAEQARTHLSQCGCRCTFHIDR